MAQKFKVLDGKLKSQNFEIFCQRKKNRQNDYVISIFCESLEFPQRIESSE